MRLFKDWQLMLYFRDLLDGYEVSWGKGLPIGNLTSQYFANHYLSVADHYAKERLGVPAMTRYMDDICKYEQAATKRPERAHWPFRPLNTTCGT